MRVYKIAKGWAIFIYITAPLLMILFSWLLIEPFISSEATSKETIWFMGPISVAMLVVLTIGLIDTFKSKFVIEDDKIYTQSTFSFRSLLYAEIKGYRISDKYIFIEPKDSSQKIIKVSTYFEKTHEIINWLDESYPDLDATQMEEETQMLLNDETLGLTDAEREKRLRNAYKVARVANGLGFLIGIWLWFYPYPYTIALMIALICPLLSVTIIWIYGSPYTLIERDDSAYASLFMFFFFPTLALFIRILFDYDILSYAPIWIPASLVTLILFFGWRQIDASLRNQNQKAYMIHAAFYTLLFFVYSYGSVIATNCLFDESTPVIYEARVISKNFTSGKHNSYYLELTPWGPRKETEQITVNVEQYERIQPKDNVRLSVKKGLWGIPWFDLEN